MRRNGDHEVGAPRRPGRCAPSLAARLFLGRARRIALRTPVCPGLRLGVRSKPTQRPSGKSPGSMNAPDRRKVTSWNYAENQKAS